jgi:hypothetical protein
MIKEWFLNKKNKFINKNKQKESVKTATISGVELLHPGSGKTFTLFIQKDASGNKEFDLIKLTNTSIQLYKNDKIIRMYSINYLFRVEYL